MTYLRFLSCVLLLVPVCVQATSNATACPSRSFLTGPKCDTCKVPSKGPNSLRAVPSNNRLHLVEGLIYTEYAIVAAVCLINLGIWLFNYSVLQKVSKAVSKSTTDEQQPRQLTMSDKMFLLTSMLMSFGTLFVISTTRGAFAINGTYAHVVKKASFLLYKTNPLTECQNWPFLVWGGLLWFFGMQLCAMIDIARHARSAELHHYKQNHKKDQESDKQIKQMQDTVDLFARLCQIIPNLIIALNVVRTLVSVIHQSIRSCCYPYMNHDISDFVFYVFIVAAIAASFGFQIDSLLTDQRRVGAAHAVWHSSGTQGQVLYGLWAAIHIALWVFWLLIVLIDWISGIWNKSSKSHYNHFFINNSFFTASKGEIFLLAACVLYLIRNFVTMYASDHSRLVELDAVPQTTSQETDSEIAGTATDQGCATCIKILMDDNCSVTERQAEAVHKILRESLDSKQKHSRCYIPSPSLSNEELIQWFLENPQYIWNKSLASQQQCTARLIDSAFACRLDSVRRCLSPLKCFAKPKSKKQEKTWCVAKTKQNLMFNPFTSPSCCWTTEDGMPRKTKAVYRRIINLE